MQITFDPRELTAKDAAMLSEFILRFHGYVAPKPEGVAPAQNAEPEPTLAQDAEPEPGIDVDSSGLPWDERIHASSRAKNGDGTWRAKRGLNDPALVKKVEDELRARLASAAFAPTPGVPEGAQREIPMVPPAPFVANAVPPAPPSAGQNSFIPSAPPAATAAPTASPFNLTFNDYVGRVAKGFASREITTDMSSAALKVVGLTDMGQLAARQDLTMTVAKELARLLAANGNFALAATFDPTVQAQ